MPKANPTTRATRNALRNMLKVTSELAKTRRDAKKAAQEAAAFVQMAMAAKKVFEKKLKNSKEETRIFRHSLQNFSSVCYNQRKEIRALKHYIRKKREQKKARIRSMQSAGRAGRI